MEEAPEDLFVIEEVADAMFEAEAYAEAKVGYEKLRDLKDIDAYKKVMAVMRLAQLEEKQGNRDKAREIYESALPMAAESSWIHREVRSRIEEGYRRQDDLPGLVAYYQGWLEKQGKDVEVALRLSDALIELSRKTEAVDWLRKASEWAPDRKEVLILLAKRLGESDTPEQAVDILKKLVQEHPEEESYRELLGNAHWQVFELKKNETAKRAAIESWQQLAPADTKDANKVSRVADMLKLHDCTEEALAGYVRAVGIAPDMVELRERHGEYLFELKRDEEAWKVVREIATGERATPVNYLRLAKLQSRHDDKKAVMESATGGLALEPKNFDLLALQWRLYSETEKWEEALALHDQLLAAAPSVYSEELVEDWHLQGLRALGRLEEVKQQMTARLEKEPLLTERELALLLRIVMQKGDLDIAEDAIEVAMKRFPDSIPLLRWKVEFEKRQGNVAERVAALEKLVELQPKQKIEWLREMARAWQDAEEWDKALAVAQRVVDAAPASSESYLLCADINFAAQRTDVGIAKLREAMKVADRPNDVRLRLARTLLEAGKGA